MSAVEQVYDLYADRLFRYLVARTGDADAAADLTTEVFLRVIKSVKGFQLDPVHPAATFGGWLYRIAGNLAGEHFRAQQRVSWLSLEDVEDRPARDPDVQETAERSEELSALARALAGLSEEQRLVVSAKFVENMSNADIAAMMGKSEGAVKSLQHRALRSLARLMQADTRKNDHE